MFVRTAFILCKAPKTDDELKAIMATHPWGPALIHGFYKVLDEKWKPDWGFWWGKPDAIWCNDGFNHFGSDNTWIVENFDVPHLYERPPSDDPFSPYEQRKDQLEKQWWNAVVVLIAHPKVAAALGITQVV
jgi:hypothetical protein